MVERKKDKKLMVHVYLSPQEKERIEEEAKKLGISLSSYIKVKLFSRGMV
jgi:predicted HicB family RNase H-like nuclease